VGLARLALLACALPFAGAGTVFLVAPDVLTSLVGMGLPGPDARSDVRAVFGGLELGVAALLVWCARSPSRVGIGLRAALLAYGGLLAGRLVAGIADGAPSAPLAAAIAVEHAAFALAGAGWMALRRSVGGA